MDKQAQQIVAVGVMILLIALAIGTCTRMVAPDPCETPNSAKVELRSKP